MPSTPHTPIRAVIFDLDGVLVTTDELHYRAWKELADAESIPFTRHDNERLRGVSRMESLEIILEKAPGAGGAAAYSPARKHALAEAKNARYRQLLASLTPADALPGAAPILRALRARAIPTAVASSSRNAREILERCALAPLLDAVADGNDITRSKPDPEVFLVAAARLGRAPRECLVVEDAEAGVEAALRGNFPVLGVGTRDRLPRAPRVAPNLADITVDDLLRP